MVHSTEHFARSNNNQSLLAHATTPTTTKSSRPSSASRSNMTTSRTKPKSKKTASKKKKRSPLYHTSNENLLGALPLDSDLYDIMEQDSGSSTDPSKEKSESANLKNHAHATTVTSTTTTTRSTKSSSQTMLETDKSNTCGTKTTMTPKTKKKKKQRQHPKASVSATSQDAGNEVPPQSVVPFQYKQVTEQEVRQALKTLSSSSSSSPTRRSKSSRRSRSQSKSSRHKSRGSISHSSRQSRNDDSDHQARDDDAAQEIIRASQQHVQRRWRAAQTKAASATTVAASQQSPQNNNDVIEDDVTESTVTLTSTHGEDDIDNSIHAIVKEIPSPVRRTMDANRPATTKGTSTQTDDKTAEEQVIGYRLDTDTNKDATIANTPPVLEPLLIQLTTPDPPRPCTGIASPFERHGGLRPSSLQQRTKSLPRELHQDKVKQKERQKQTQHDASRENRQRKKSLSVSTHDDTTTTTTTTPMPSSPINTANNMKVMLDFEAVVVAANGQRRRRRGRSVPTRSRLQKRRMVERQTQLHYVMTPTTSSSSSSTTASEAPKEADDSTRREKPKVTKTDALISFVPPPPLVEAEMSSSNPKQHCDITEPTLLDTTTALALPPASTEHLDEVDPNGISTSFQKQSKSSRNYLDEKHGAFDSQEHPTVSTTDIVPQNDDSQSSVNNDISMTDLVRGSNNATHESAYDGTPVRLTVEKNPEDEEIAIESNVHQSNKSDPVEVLDETMSASASSSSSLSCGLEPFQRQFQKSELKKNEVEKEATAHGQIARDDDDDQPESKSQNNSMPVDDERSIHTADLSVYIVTSELNHDSPGSSLSDPATGKDSELTILDSESLSSSFIYLTDATDDESAHKTLLHTRTSKRSRDAIQSTKDHDEAPTKFSSLIETTYADSQKGDNDDISATLHERHLSKQHIGDIPTHTEDSCEQQDSNQINGTIKASLSWKDVTVSVDEVLKQDIPKNIQEQNEGTRKIGRVEVNLSPAEREGVKSTQNRLNGQYQNDSPQEVKTTPVKKPGKKRKTKRKKAVAEAAIEIDSSVNNVGSTEQLRVPNTIENFQTQFECHAASFIKNKPKKKRKVSSSKEKRKRKKGENPKPPEEKSSKSSGTSGIKRDNTLHAPQPFAKLDVEESFEAGQRKKEEAANNKSSHPTMSPHALKIKRLSSQPKIEEKYFMKQKFMAQDGATVDLKTRNQKIKDKMEQRNVECRPDPPGSISQASDTKVYKISKKGPSAKISSRKNHMRDQTRPRPPRHTERKSSMNESQGELESDAGQDHAASDNAFNQTKSLQSRMTNTPEMESDNAALVRKSNANKKKAFKIKENPEEVAAQEGNRRGKRKNKSESTYKQNGEISVSRSDPESSFSPEHRSRSDSFTQIVPRLSSKHVPSQVSLAKDSLKTNAIDSSRVVQIDDERKPLMMLSVSSDPLPSSTNGVRPDAENKRSKIRKERIMQLLCCRRNEVSL